MSGSTPITFIIRTAAPITWMPGGTWSTGLMWASALTAHGNSVPSKPTDGGPWAGAEVNDGNALALWRPSRRRDDSRVGQDSQGQDRPLHRRMDGPHPRRRPAHREGTPRMAQGQVRFGHEYGMVAGGARHGRPRRFSRGIAGNLPGGRRALC